jgi:hypothetical protein
VQLFSCHADEVIHVDGVGGNFNLETDLDTLGSCTIDFKKIFDELEAVKQDTNGGVSSLQSSQVSYVPLGSQFVSLLPKVEICEFTNLCHSFCRRNQQV